MGLLWHILEGTIPTDFLTSNRNGSPGTQILMINRIVRACSALVNLFPANSCPFSVAFNQICCIKSEYIRRVLFFLHQILGSYYFLWPEILSLNRYPPLISNDGLSARRVDTFWIFRSFPVACFSRKQSRICQSCAEGFSLGSPHYEFVVQSIPTILLKQIVFSFL